MNVVIYARFSSHSQTEQSIEGQLKVCYEYAESNHYTVVGEYIDRAISGTTDNRAEFQRMISDSDKHTFEGVLVYQLDRFARNRYDSAINKAKLKKNGVRVLSAKENIADDASGILVEGVLESMAEYYSVELSQKIHRGMAINAEKCLSNGSNPGLGFKVDAERRFYVNEEEAAIVREIYERYASGETKAEIIRDLKQRRVKTSLGKEFSPNSLSHLLSNKRYIGVYLYKGKETPGGMPRILDDDLFYRVQSMMNKNKNAPARAHGEGEYLLTTKLFCGHCKEMMVGYGGTSKTGRQYHYYMCKNARRKKCGKKIVSKSYIEDRVVNECLKMLTEEKIRFIAKKVAEECAKSPDNLTAKALKKAIREADTAIENLWKAIEQGRAVEMLTERLNKRMAEKAELEAQLAIEENKKITLTEAQILAFLDYVCEMPADDVNKRRAIINIFVHSIYLYDDHFTLIINASKKPLSIDNIPLDDIETAFEGEIGALEGCSSLSTPAPPSPSWCNHCKISVYILSLNHERGGKTTMTSSKSTKRALIFSTLAILLCAAMLIGTTFAWFTDTASTGVNKIQAGNLNIELQMKDNTGNWVTAEGKTLSFLVNGEIPADETQILWEPGCTYTLPELRVVNNGNLALKYKVVVSGIQGSAKLNEVIDWTMHLDGADFIMGSEHSLAAKNNDTVDFDSFTISGTMDRAAGNEYQNESIEGISINVYATQDTVESDSFGNTYDKDADGTPQFDTWYDNVAATVPVAADGDTVVKDRETAPTIQATIPAGSTTASELTLIKSKGETPSNITVVAGTKALTVEVKLVDQDGNKVTAKSGKFFTVSMQLGKNLNIVDFYHNEMALAKVADVNSLTANDRFFYDAAAGYVTFTTDDFSPFTAIVSDSAFNGGNGTEANPYLIATAEQAMQIEKLNKKSAYLKLVNDITVPDEIYISKKSFVFDLNGHTVKLEYAEGVKPNNGSVLYIGGRGGNLTINDSSEAQTGAVIGSDKTYPNKVTCAVRAGNYGKLTINGGHFYGTSEGTSCIFVYTNTSSNSKATVTINGGKFETATPSNGTYFVLNHQDGATAGCTITVNGGSFRNYNPGETTVDPVNAKTGKIVLGKGCTTTQDGEWYVVSK